MLSALTSVTRRRVMPVALLLAALLALPAVRSAHAIGEPTLTISMNNLALTAGTTSLVTFQFSAVPIGFDNSDVNLSDANGNISAVTPGGDARVWTATFTPNVGIYDETNTISVGVQWTDTLGVSPLGTSTGPNYSIQTTASTASSCPPPSVSLASPVGGEAFAAGAGVDVFWTANGCQVTALELALSTDGGVSYAAPFAVSSAPFSGYYRWTVPDIGSTTTRLRATLLGTGGIEFATDATGSDFSISPSSSPSSVSDAPAPVDVSETTPEAPPPPAEQPTQTELAAPSDGGGAADAPVTAPIAQAEPAPAPTPPRLSTAQASQSYPSSSPSIVALAPESPPPTPSENESTSVIEPPKSMPETIENQTITIDGVQGAVESASAFAPSYMELGFSFALGALAMLAAMLGARKVMRDRRDRQGRTCSNCRGTGEKPKDDAALVTCTDCDGLGTIEEEEEQSVECTHCGGEGTDPCHECKGEGKRADGEECSACRGGGLTLDDPEDEQSDEPADCEICGGEGEVGTTVKKQVACETCHGSGKS